MADIYLLAERTLPEGVSHESLPLLVTLFIADCWAGMSRTQMIARAKRRGLRLSFRATAPCPSGETGVFELRFNDDAVECLMLAQLQRIRDTSGRAGKPAGRKSPAHRRAIPRQTRLF
ncbi:hypothetical protein ACFFYR_31690 [Paraburkholderia dipogonis]|uniref:hypothetical protein n=1 Tax=Paraburkholderia dipogonis TaxID=1211383 RepID=UPI001FCB696D|nr:hypothetical protein [Paraburkholderia dipogonis]